MGQLIHPFCVLLAGTPEGMEKKLAGTEIDLDRVGVVKVWIDGDWTLLYRRPEVLDFPINRKPIWACDVASAE